MFKELNKNLTIKEVIDEILNNKEFYLLVYDEDKELFDNFSKKIIEKGYFFSDRVPAVGNKPWQYLTIKKNNERKDKVLI